jgi:hypothetical protein
MSWLDKLVEGTKYSESPSRYFWWGGIAAIASVVSKRIVIQRHYYKLYPNVYVALVSSKSGLRKGVPIAIIKSMVEALDSVRVMSGCNSIQGLTKELGIQKTFDSGGIVDTAQGLLLSDEFESFLTDDPRALTILTALHNTHEHEKSWTKMLKNSPLETLKSPCLSLLVASNEVLFHSIVKGKDIEGGFIARTFVVHETYRRTVNSLVYAPPEKLDKDSLVEELKEISKVEGEFVWTEDGGKRYDEWYHALCAKETDDRTGTMERLGDQVIKVAMIVGLASGAGRTKPLEITTDYLDVAIKECEECIAGVRRIATGDTSGSEEQDKAIPAIIKALINAQDGKLTRQRLLTKTGLDALILDRAIQTLTERGTIKQPYRNSSRQITYEIEEDVLELYKQFKVQQVSS